MASFLLAAVYLFFRCVRLVWLYVWSLRGRKSHQHVGSTDLRRLSKSTAHIKPSYDVVVIGSGYGGGIAASRMARAAPQQSVCLLERGKERWPGEYPSSFWRAISELRFTGHLRTPLKSFAFDIGKRTGLYHWFVGKGSNVFVGTGLGGTSLLNAGVFMRARPEVLQATEWPTEIRKPGSLDEYYQRAEAMLEPTPYPSTFPSLRKFEVLLEQAAAVGLADSCRLVPQTTTFESGTNAAGVAMQASTLSSQESMGSNDGSKNSLLVSYLADAWASGTDIFCDCDVRYVQKHPVEGYLVFFRKQGETQLSWVHARKFVFLGAGALGSTEIVLRSQKQGLRLSPNAGANISGNGSMLAFGCDLNRRVNSVGTAQTPVDPPGPTITGTIDCRDSAFLEQQFMIQDGAFPTIMAAFFRMVHIFLRKVPVRTHSWRNVLSKRAYAAIRGFDTLQNSQCYLVLAHDNSGGRLSLKQDQPSLDLRDMRHTGKPGYIRKILIAMTHALGGVFIEPLFGVVVHPLGGLGMSRDGTGKGGATTHTGEVLSGEGTEVHQGLVVVDGALLPRSLGSNPLATICALAERAVQLAIDRSGLSVDLAARRRFEILRSQKAQKKVEPQIEFSEVMEGHLELEGHYAAFALSMTINLKETEAQDGFTGSITGIACCSKLSKDPLLIKKGSFKLFELDQSIPLQRKMIYDLILVKSTGEELHLLGMKTINTSIGLSPLKAWRATTTLATSLSRFDGSLVGEFDLHISLAGFLTQLASLRVVGPDARANRRLLLRFVLHFVRRLYEVMFVPFATRLQYPEDVPRSRPAKSLKSGPDSFEEVVASDGVKTGLRMWEPLGSKPATRNLLLIPGGAVTHEIFALPTMTTNAIEYFTARGYRCWCITHRAADIDRTKDKRSWTTFDARLDIKAALEIIREKRGSEPIIAVAHCVGSGALACGLLDGTIPSHWLSGILASQFFLHPVVTRQNQLKARLPLVGIYRLLAGDWYACNPCRKETLIQRILTQALRFYPQTESKERCNSVVCLRNCLPFGRLWNHANLNQETHSRLGEIFSGISTDCIEHLAGMGLAGIIRDRDGHNLVTDGNLERLRGVPVFLFVGADNQVYQSSATLRTQKLLQSKFGAQAARREVFEGLGHLDCWMSDVASEPSGVFETTMKEVDLMLSEKQQK